MRRLPGRDGLTPAGGLFAEVVGESAVPAATGLVHTPSVAYVRKTSPVLRQQGPEAVIGSDYRSRRTKCLPLSSDKSLSFASVGRPSAWTRISVGRGVIRARLTKSSIVRCGSIRADSTVYSLGGRGCFAHHRADTGTTE